MKGAWQAPTPRD